LQYGKRKDVWSKQDHLRLPGQLGSGWNNNSDALIFYHENQSCEAWGIRTEDLVADDPPVYRFDDPGLVSPSISTFAIMVLLHEVKFTERAAWGQSADEVAEVIAAAYTRAAGVPEEYWAGEPHQFFEGRDLVVEISWANETLYVTPRTEEAFQRVDQTIRQQLERN
jgi:hypothetical protein